MNQTYNPKLSANARALRRNMTREERHLWYDFLRDLPVMVHRQKVIGSYIADFYVAEKKIVIEVDGSQHYAPQCAHWGGCGVARWEFITPHQSKTVSKKRFLPASPQGEA